MNLSVTGKRSLAVSLSNIESNEPPLKKQKLENNASNTTTSSLWFRNSCDHQQFVGIFKIIDNSQLIKSLNVPQCINKEISEYATGSFVKCNHCNNSIPILFEDKQIYDNNDKNANKLGYKYCMYSNKYFCSECMDKVKKNDECDCDCSQCMELHYIPECDKCDVCKSVIFNYDSVCGCSECEGIHCNNCDFKTCDNCYNFDLCAECDNYFCAKCKTDRVDWNNPDYCVCNDCYVDTIIECNKCNGKCPLFFKSNRRLGPINNDEYEMIRCSYGDCDCFVCFKCDQQERNGKYFECQNNGCYVKRVYCNKHSENVFQCYWHQKQRK